MTNGTYDYGMVNDAFEQSDDKDDDDTMIEMHSRDGSDLLARLVWGWKGDPREP